MEEFSEVRKLLASEFKECQKAILALGDETRQRIILVLLENEKVGMRVGEITKETNLSRPAVSHHLQVLKDAKIIAMRRKGTMNFYYINADETEWGKLTRLMEHIYTTVKRATEEDYPNNCLGKEE